MPFLPGKVTQTRGIHFYWAGRRTEKNQPIGLALTAVLRGEKIKNP